MITTRVIIIGAGPIGIELAVALKRAGIDHIVLEAKQIGHTISWFAPGTHFFSSNERIAIAGVPLQTLDQSKATREEYLQYLRSVVMLNQLRINSYEPVTSIAREGGGFVVTTRPLRGQQQYRAEYVVLATGGTAAPRRLGIPGEDLPHVSHYFEEPHKYFGQRVLVVGGRNSAVEAALRCHHAGSRVAISYRRQAFDPSHVKYWLLPEINAYVKSGRIVGHFCTRPTEITPTHARLAPVNGDVAPTLVEADFVLLLVGYVADMSLARMAGVELGANDVPVFDPGTMQTNIPNLFVAGTATGGTQEKYRVFIENCHVHVDRIVAAIKGEAPPEATRPRQEVTEMPES